MIRKIGDGCWFKILYFLLAAFSFNSWFYENSWLPSMALAVIIAGGFIGAYRLFGISAYLSTPLSGGWLIFCLSYLLSSLLNQSYGLTENLQALVWLFFQTFLLYAIREDKTETVSRREYRVFTNVVIGYSGFCALAANLKADAFFMLQGPGPAGGMPVFTDENYGAVLCCVSMVFCLYYIRTFRRLRLLYLTLFGLLCLYVIRSGSSVGMLCMTLSLLIYYINDCMTQRGKKRNFRRNLLVGLLLLVLCAGGFAVQNLRPAPPAPQMVSGTEEAEAAAEVPAEVPAGILPERWVVALNFYTESPLLGVSYRNIPAFGSAHELYTSDMYDTFHNMPLNVLVSEGLLGFMILVVMTYWIFRRMILMWRLYREAEDDFYIVPLLAVICIFMSSLFLSDIFYVNTPTSVVFWTSLGYAVHYVQCATAGRHIKNSKGETK